MTEVLSVFGSHDRL